jgi:hypothetical protein
MDRLWIASTWLLTTASALSPLIALLIGFAGTDRLLRWQSAGNAVASPTPEAGEISKRSAKALLLSIPRRPIHRTAEVHAAPRGSAPT